MSLTKASYSMINGAPVNVLDYGADNTGVNDSYSAFSQAWSAIKSTGGILFIPPGTYLLNTAWVCDIDLINPHNYKISGYGATIKSGSSVTDWAMTIKGGYNNFGVTVEGLQFYQIGNTNVSGAIQGLGTNFLTLNDCTVELDNNKSGYSAFQLTPLTFGDSATACILSVINNCTTRQRTGNLSTYAPCGLKLIGQANGTTITNCSFSSVIYGILVEPDPVNGDLSNGCRVLYNNIEGPSYGIAFVTDSPATYTPTGWFVAFNRVESVNTFIVWSGPLVNESSAPLVSQSNYITTGSVTNYIVNPNNQKVNIFESSYYSPGAPNVWGGPNSLTFITEGIGNNLTVENESGTSNWAAAHFVMGTFHLWVDNLGKLRIKDGAPTSNTDGVVVGTQT